jgi:hypothetical protein
MMGPKETKKPKQKAARKRKSDPMAPPFPSPTNSDGPTVPAPRQPVAGDVLQVSRAGFPGSHDRLPIGFPLDHNMCYRNATLSLLMNIPQFVGYLSHLGFRTRSTGDSVLSELEEIATAYWSDGSDDKRRDGLPDIIGKLWQNLRHLTYDNDPMTVGWGPFLDKKERETQQDAGDFLECLLTNGDASLQYQL